MSSRSRSRRVRVQFGLQVLLGAVVLTVAVLAIFAAMRTVNGERTTAADGNRRSVQVMTRVDELQRLATDVETNARAAALTGEALFGARSRASARRIDAEVAELRRLTEGRESTSATDSLTGAIKAFVAEGAEIRKNGADELARVGASTFATRGSIRIDELDARFDVFRAIERRLAAERDVQTELAVGRGTRAAWIALGGGIALIVLSGTALALQERRRRRVAAELRRSERRAREANALFEAGFAGAATGLSAGLADGTLLQVNPRLSELTGYSAAELLDGGSRLFWSEDQVESALGGLDALWKGLIPRIDVELPFLHAGGEPRWMAVGASCVRAADGSALFVLAQYQDVTARHEAERRVEETRAALELTQARHRAILESIDEVVFQASLTGRWRLLSPAFARLTGIPLEDALGQAAIDFVHPADQDRHVDHHARLMLSSGAGNGVVEYEHRYRGAGGDVRWMAVEAHVTTDPETGGPVISGIMRDVTALRDAEDAAARNLDNLATIAEVARALPAGGDARQAIVDAAAKLVNASGVSLFEPDGHVLSMTASTYDSAEVPAIHVDQHTGVAVTFRSGEPLFVADTMHHEAVSPDAAQRFGTASAMYVPVIHDEQVIAVLGLGWADPLEQLPQQDEAILSLLVAEAAVAIDRADLIARVETMARTDELTGLPNRREWTERMRAETSRARRHGFALCVAVLDIDYFKRVNDTLGHAGGDRLLVEASEAWRASLRDVDLLARWGGEEFAVALPACDIESAMIVVERLRAVMPGGQTCSAGVAMWDGHESAEALLARADDALYRAKQNGRDRTERATFAELTV